MCNANDSRNEVIDEEGGEEWVRGVSGKIEQQHLSIIYKKKEARKKKEETRKKDQWIMA